MASRNPQRPKLVQVEEIASKIARCEIDAQMRHAHILHLLERTIDGFPVNIPFLLLTLHTDTSVLAKFAFPQAQIY